jgi:hypothetical protein
VLRDGRNTSPKRHTHKPASGKGLYTHDNTGQRRALREPRRMRGRGNPKANPKADRNNNAVHGKKTTTQAHTCICRQLKNHSHSKTANNRPAPPAPPALPRCGPGPAPILALPCTARSLMPGGLPGGLNGPASGDSSGRAGRFEARWAPLVRCACRAAGRHPGGRRAGAGGALVRGEATARHHAPPLGRGRS